MAESKTNKIEKVIVAKEDELIDLIRKIEKSKHDQIVFIYTEDSDLLISPINMRVIQKTADEKGKIIVNQIIHNNAGVNNSRTAGIITSDTPTPVSTELWESAEVEMRKRTRENSGKLRRVDSAPVLNGADEKTDLTATENSLVEHDGKQAGKTVETTETERETSEEIKEKDNKPEAVIEGAMIEHLPEEKHLSSFEERIAKALEKSEKDHVPNKDLDQQDGFIMAIDKDISEVMPNAKLHQKMLELKPLTHLHLQAHKIRQIRTKRNHLLAKTLYPARLLSLVQRQNNHLASAQKH